MTIIECRVCHHLIGEALVFMFYQQSPKSFHLIIKPEKRNQVLGNLIIKTQSNPKAKKIKPYEIFCIKCENKIGTDLLIGPNAEGVICMRTESLKVKDPSGRIHEFDGSAKWSEKRDIFHDIEFRDLNTFHGSNPSMEIETDESSFEPTKHPTIDEIRNFNIAALISDMPRTYQVEIYVASLVANTVCYLPTGSGKTMVAAMVAAFMHKTNPKKKIFFVCDRIPLVFQQVRCLYIKIIKINFLSIFILINKASYLRAQTGLTVGEFCGENRDLFKSQLDSDILVFTADFLINKLFAKTLFIQDCSCLIIDEIHHANRDHSFSRLIQDFYYTAAQINRPKLLGLTASPSSELKEDAIYNQLTILSALIDGRVYMPRVYLEDFNRIIIRPQIRFGF